METQINTLKQFIENNQSFIKNKNKKDSKRLNEHMEKCLLTYHTKSDSFYDKELTRSHNADLIKIKLREKLNKQKS